MDTEAQTIGFVFSDANVRADLTKLNQRVSPFLKLPAEIRNTIYELTCADGIVMVRRYEPPSYHGAFELLHACRQVRFELLPVFCRHTTFYLGLLTPGAVESKYYHFTGTTIKSILLCDDFLDKGVHEFGRLMPNVEHIYVQISVHQWRIWQRFSVPISLEMKAQAMEAMIREISGNQHVKLHYRIRRVTFRGTVLDDSEVAEA